MENFYDDVLMEDKELKCSDCKEPFIFTIGEQKFYIDKGFSAPRRCEKCRQQKKQKFIEKKEY